MRTQQFIRQARQCWISNRYQEALEYLGEALHYIQDGCVPPASSGWHSEFEEVVDSYLPVLINHALRYAYPADGEINTLQLVGYAVPQRDPSSACTTGIGLSFSIALSVCGPPWSNRVDSVIAAIHNEYVEAAKYADRNEIARLVISAAKYNASRGLLRLVRRFFLRRALHKYTRSGHLAGVRNKLSSRYRQVQRLEGGWFILPPLNPEVYSVELVSFQYAVRVLRIPPKYLADRANRGLLTTHWILSERWFYRSQLLVTPHTYGGSSRSSPRFSGVL